MSQTQSDILNTHKKQTPDAGKQAQGQDSDSATDACASKDSAKPMDSKHTHVNLPSGRWYRFGVWLESKISRLSVRNTFWHRVCSLVWMPLAYRSGIKVQKGSISSFAAILPFRRFNRNWYKAMAGGALLANSELAGGMYVFRECAGDWTVVCKELNYKFLRPCFGPAVYNIEPREDLKGLLATGQEFNITLDMEIVQMVQAKIERQRRVGICTASFHVTPKTQHRKRKHWQKLRAKQKQIDRELEARDQSAEADTDSQNPPAATP